MSKGNDLRELAKLVFGDDPKLAQEATRLEALVAAGEIEEADIAISRMALDRMTGRRNGIDVALVRVNAALMHAYAKRGAVEDVERYLAMLESTDWEPRARKLAVARLDELDCGALAERIASVRRKLAG